MVGGLLAVRIIGGRSSALPPSRSLTYTPEGYGGYIAKTPPAASATKAANEKKQAASPSAAPGSKAPIPDPVAPVLAAYEKGRYGEAEAAAQVVIAQAKFAPSVAKRREAARARRLMAFAAARRRDLSLARTRFALLKTEAAQLPDKGKPATTPLGEAPAPTLEEDAAYQHAVCTGALGDKQAAEAEYVAFMKTYPTSPLVQATIKRIARLHGGDIPKEAEAVWRQAMQTQQAQERKKERDASLCAPECLAELLRRSGKRGEVSGLATEMKTSEQGTTLAALVRAAKRHGFPSARGLALTQKGLRQQRLPVIALVSPGHFVIVESATSEQVTAWDPDAGQKGASSRTVAPPQQRRTYPTKEWERLWQGGIAVALKAEGAASGAPTRSPH